MSARLSLRETRENGTFVKLQHILVFLKYFVYIMYYYVVWGYFAFVFQFSYTYFDYLPKFHQNQFFIYFYGFKLLVWYNLVLCYSLKPVLVIWHVTFIIFLQNLIVFPKLKKSKFW